MSCRALPAAEFDRLRRKLVDVCSEAIMAQVRLEHGT